MSNCIEMRVQAGSKHIFSAQRLSCLWQRRGRLFVWAINLWTCWETKNCSELQSIARLVNFNCVLMQLIAPCNRAYSFTFINKLKGSVNSGSPFITPVNDNFKCRTNFSIIVYNLIIIILQKFKTIASIRQMQLSMYQYQRQLANESWKYSGYCYFVSYL